MYDVEHIFWVRRDEGEVSGLDDVHGLLVDVVEPTHDLILNAVQVFTVYCGC